MIAMVSKALFGTLDDGQQVNKYTLRNEQGAQAVFTNLGASWIGFQLHKDQPNLVLGCDTLDALLSQQAYLGATVGRFANRISNAQFNLNGQTIQLDSSINTRPHQLHGGPDGFSSKVWQSNIELVDDTIPTLTFSLHSPEGESGFPGNMDATVCITLTNDNCIRFEYSANTDKPTIANFTNHAYFNLNGSTEGSLQNHLFKLESLEFLEANNDGIPSGKIIDASQSALDLTQWQDIQDRITQPTDDRLKRAEGFDHCFCYKNDKKLKLLGSAKNKSTNVEMQCYSDLPGMQFYTGNFLGGTPRNNTDRYQGHGAFCFEPGYWPDSPNQPTFPDCTIDANSGYSAIIEYVFHQ